MHPAAAAETSSQSSGPLPRGNASRHLVSINSPCVLPKGSSQPASGNSPVSWHQCRPTQKGELHWRDVWIVALHWRDVWIVALGQVKADALSCLLIGRVHISTAEQAESRTTHISATSGGTAFGRMGRHRPNRVAAIEHKERSASIGKDNSTRPSPSLLHHLRSSPPRSAALSPIHSNFPSPFPCDNYGIRHSLLVLLSV